MLILDHIQLAMPQGQEEEARHFYGDILKLQELEKPDLLKSKGGVLVLPRRSSASLRY